MEDNERRTTIFFLAGAWLCKPIPVEEVLKNSKLQENIFCRAGSQSFDKNSISPNLLREFFPDWGERVKYQTEKTKLCKSAQKKLQNFKTLFPPSMHMKLLTHQEKDALDYFRGTGFYAHYQNPKVKPNIFDSRRSFLIKMQNFEMRNTFLKTYHQYHKK